MKFIYINQNLAWLSIFCISFANYWLTSANCQQISWTFFQWKNISHYTNNSGFFFYKYGYHWSSVLLLNYSKRIEWRAVSFRIWRVWEYQSSWFRFCKSAGGTRANINICHEYGNPKVITLQYYFSYPQTGEVGLG